MRMVSSLGSRAQIAFEIADRADAQPCPFGQFLLAEPGNKTVAPNERGELS